MKDTITQAEFDKITATGTPDEKKRLENKLIISNDAKAIVDAIISLGRKK